MKLNLLPATVSKGAQAKSAWVITIVLAFLSIGGSIAMVMASSKRLADAKAAEEAAKPGAAAAVAMAAKGDTLMQDPKVGGLIRNVALAQAMIEHNAKYPTLYNSMLPYIPPFYRLTQLSATPISDQQAAVTMVGTLGTYQQYADLMLALMRNPNAVSVSRSGFVLDAPIVPNLVEIDQQGKPRKQGEAPIPDDPLERLTFFEAQGSQTQGFTGAGNFGTGTDTTRQAMPGQSLVQVQIVVNAAIQVPNPRATLTASGGGGAPAAGRPGGPMGGPPMGGPPMGGPPMGGPGPVGRGPAN
jgi:hypothetical protein